MPKIIDAKVLKSVILYEKSDLGLNPPADPNYVENALVRVLRGRPYIPEARGTFEAIVPDRYKRKG